MNYTPLASFRRPLDAAQLARPREVMPSSAVAAVSKWDVLRDLTAARRHYGLGDRDVAVLQALLSFHPETLLTAGSGDLVVHPSNQSICDRLGGMPCSTMRRHLARLVDSGMLLRRDSPNGKRFSRGKGIGRMAFGLDLLPLAMRSAEIRAMAEQQRADDERLHRLRLSVSLMRRDLCALVDHGRTMAPTLPLWIRLDDMAILCARSLRRKLNEDDLSALAARLQAALDEAQAAVSPEPAILPAPRMSTRDACNEQHHQSSDKNPSESEIILESSETIDHKTQGQVPGASETAAVPLSLLLEKCSELKLYSEQPLNTWPRVSAAAERIRPMMGITPELWEQARRQMGREAAISVLAAILQRFDKIRSPGAYLRSLTAKAAAGRFSCLPMLAALRPT